MFLKKAFKVVYLYIVKKICLIKHVNEKITSTKHLINCGKIVSNRSTALYFMNFKNFLDCMFRMSIKNTKSHTYMKFRNNAFKQNFEMY